MLYRLFALMGVHWAIRKRAVADLPKLRAALVALSKPGIQLSNEAYRIADSYETETIRSEHERDSLKLRAKYARRCVQVGLVKCTQTLGQALNSELQDIAEREGLFGQLPRKTKAEEEISNDQKTQPD